MLKKVWYKIRTFFYLFFKGLHQADKVAFGNKEEALNKDSSYEQQQEQDCVWNDLIKGEVTQRVIDLRYETAHAVRESNKYEYIGNGNVVKKNMFEYKGNIFKNNDDNIILVQDNSIVVQGTYEINPIKEYVIKVLCSFIPKYRIDSYIKKIVLRKTNEDNLLLDIYFSEYLEKYNNEHKFFISEFKKLYNDNDLRTSIVDIEGVTFTTKRAFGDNDDVIYDIFFNGFLKVDKFDGNYILVFDVKDINKYDLIEKVYNEKSAEKFNKKISRTNDNITISYNDAESIEIKKKEDDRYYKEYKALMEELDGE